jgi:hypothetical protein
MVCDGATSAYEAIKYHYIERQQQSQSQTYSIENKLIKSTTEGKRYK